MKEEKYNRSIPGNSKSQSAMNRRDFLKNLGGGLIIVFSVGNYSYLFGDTVPPQQEEEDLNAYLRIGEDGRVTLFTGKIEMGQGPITSLPQMLADELDVAYESIDIIMGDTDLCPWDAGTWGSMTTRFFGPPLRAAGAEARAILMQMASEYLKLPVDQLMVENGVISDINNEKNRVTYAQLTKGEKIIRELKEKPAVKDPSELKVMGKPYFRTDSLEKVTGKAKYAGDIQLPGMLYAKMLRPPAHGAKLVSLDMSAAEKMQDVVIVREDDLIAVLHEIPDVAEEAITKIKAEFEFEPSTVNQHNIFEHLLNSATASNEVDKGGDLEEGGELSDLIFESEYHDGYVAHAPIETHTATATMEGEKMKIWASTQTPFGMRTAVAQTLKMPEENVRVMQIFTGGGFGGKSYPGSQVIEAARLTKITGKPVQVVWSRREEFFYDTYRPAAVVKITSGITKTGKIRLWDYGEYFAGSRGAAHFYNIPHHKTVSYSTGRSDPDAHFFGTGPWRAPGNNTNTWARESQIEIMASRAGIDPLEFRLQNLKDEKMIGVLKAAADKFGWTPAKGPSGRGWGIACGIDAGTYVAHMAEVKVDKNTGKVKVDRVVCAQNMGLAVNPQGAILQVESCINMGLGYALSEDIEFEGGNIQTRNFDTYQFTRFSWTPEIEVVLIDAKDSPPQGGGEPPIISMGGLIANAIFDATGARLFQLPMTPERVLAALNEK
jgi:nicotinate dehydrogenase subunit B